MKIDLEDLERKARAAATQDEWQWRPGDLNILEGKHDGQIVIYVHRSREEDLDKLLVASNRDRAHIAANSPPVTLALITRIRELEAGMRDMIDEIAANSEDPEELAADRALLAKGVVLT